MGCSLIWIKEDDEEEEGTKQRKRDELALKSICIIINQISLWTQDIKYIGWAN